jgi:hypothetical protein
MYPRCFVRSCILVLTWFSSKKIRNCSTMFPKVAAYYRQLTFKTS